MTLISGIPDKINCNILETFLSTSRMWNNSFRNLLFCCNNSQLKKKLSVKRTTQTYEQQTLTLYQYVISTCRQPLSPLPKIIASEKIECHHVTRKNTRKKLVLGGLSWNSKSISLYGVVYIIQHNRNKSESTEKVSGLG